MHMDPGRVSPEDRSHGGGAVGGPDLESGVNVDTVHAAEAQADPKAFHKEEGEECQGPDCLVQHATIAWRDLHVVRASCGCAGACD